MIFVSSWTDFTTSVVISTNHKPRFTKIVSKACFPLGDTSTLLCLLKLIFPNVAPFPTKYTIVVLCHMTHLRFLICHCVLRDSWSQERLKSCVRCKILCFASELSSHGANLGCANMFAVPWSNFGFNGKVQ